MAEVGAMMLNHLIRAIMGLILVPALLAGQSPQDPLTFRSQVQYIEVDVLVTDADGKPVRGLTKEDFSILEDGVPQEIRSVSFVELPIEPSASRAIVANAAEPDTVTNVGNGRSYVMMLNRGGNRSRLLARRFIEEAIGPNDQLAVVHVLGNMSAGQGFTRSRSQMLAAIDRIDLADVNDEPSFWGDPVVASFEVLEAIVNRLAAIDGRRKVVLWFDPPSVFHGLDARGAARRFAQRDAVRVATRNNVALYVVDTLGLTTATGLDNLERQAGIRVLAEDTGGDVIVNTNNFSGGYERFVRDNSAYYLLGYTPTVEHRDGQFHSLTVRVNRKELVVRARRGYYAEESGATATAAATGGLSPKAMSALRLPSSTAGLGIELFAVSFKHERNAGSVVIGAELHGGDLVLGPDEPMEIGYQAMTSDGTVTPGRFHVLRLNFTPESRAEVARNGIRIVERLQLPRGRHQVRFAVHQPNGKTGTVIADVDVPDYAKPLVMSGVVIGSQIASSHRTLLSDGRTRNVLRAEPTALRRFARNDVVTAFAEVYTDSRRSTDELQVTASVETPDGKRIFTPILIGTREEPGRVGNLARIPLAGLTPRDYVLAFEARLGRESIKRQVPFTVLAE